MKIFKDTYDAEVVDMSIDQFNQFMNEFDREVELVDVQLKADYFAQFDVNNTTVKNITMINKLSTIDLSKTIVLHFDSVCDIYITV